MLMSARDLGRILMDSDADGTKLVVVDGRVVLGVEHIQEGWEDGFIVAPHEISRDNAARNKKMGHPHPQGKCFDGILITSNRPYTKLVCINPIEDLDVKNQDQKFLNDIIVIEGDDSADEMSSYKDHLVSQGIEK